jgi:hypothetical protein
MVISSAGVAMANCDHGSEERARTGSWLGDMLRPFNFITVLRERSQIRRICAESLEIYRRIEREMAGASNLERYARVIEEQSGADPNTVQAVIRRAEESFASWPVERPLNFRDVVQYMAVTGGLKADIAVTGVRSPFVDLVFAIVTDMIPANL